MGRKVYLVTKYLNRSASSGPVFTSGSWWDTVGHWYIVIANHSYEVTGQGKLLITRRSFFPETTGVSVVGSTSASDNDLRLAGRTPCELPVARLC